MDQISRRSFLKGAGMTALAVAAVGMMTGCKGEDVVPDPQKVDVAVIFYQSGVGVVSELPTGKIQVVEKAAEAGQAADKAEIEKLLADQKKWKLDETDPSNLTVHPSKDAADKADDLARAVLKSGLNYYVTVNVAVDKGF